MNIICIKILFSRFRFTHQKLNRLVFLSQKKRKNKLNTKQLSKDEYILQVDQIIQNLIVQKYGSCQIKQLIPYISCDRQYQTQHTQLCSILVQELNNINLDEREPFLDAIITICLTGVVTDNGWCAQLLNIISINCQEQINQLNYSLIRATLEVYEEQYYPLEINLANRLLQIIVNGINAHKTIFYGEIQGNLSKLINQCNNHNVQKDCINKSQYLSQYNDTIDCLQEICHILIEKGILHENILNECINVFICITIHPNITFLELCSKSFDLIKLQYSFIQRLLQIYTMPYSLCDQIYSNLDDDYDSMCSSQESIKSNAIGQDNDIYANFYSNNKYYDSSKWNLEIASQLLNTLGFIVRCAENEVIRALSINRKCVINVVLLCLNDVTKEAKSALSFLLVMQDYTQFWEELLYYHFRGKNCLADVLIKLMRSLKLDLVNYASLLYEDALMHGQNPTQYEVQIITQTLCTYLEMSQHQLTNNSKDVQSYKQNYVNSDQQNIDFHETVNEQQEIQQPNDQCRLLNNIIQNFKAIIKYINFEYQNNEIIYPILENAHNWMTDEFLAELKEG